MIKLLASIPRSYGVHSNKKYGGTVTLSPSDGSKIICRPIPCSGQYSVEQRLASHGTVSYTTSRAAVASMVRRTRTDYGGDVVVSNSRCPACQQGTALDYDGNVDDNRYNAE